VEIDRYEIGAGGIGPVTRELERIFHDVLRGRVQRYTHWRTPVGVAVPA
jgi:branched-chain amino acid aminotransferase